MLRELQTQYNKVQMTSPSKIYAKCKDIRKADKEVFMVFHLNTKNQIVCREIVSMGTLNTCIIHPREIFKGAILNSANAIILAHNHPSGDTTPSKEDKEVTEKLVQAGKILDIKVLDHVIVGNGLDSFSDNHNL